MESLPDEVLEEVFSYFGYEDFVKTLQNVNTRWRRVSRTTHLWKHFEYIPSYKKSDVLVTQMLKMSPKLQAVDFGQRLRGDDVFQVLSDSCPELIKMQMSMLQNVNEQVLQNLQQKCPKIEYLEVSGMILSCPAKCEIVAGFTNLKTLCISGCRESNVSLKLIADGCARLEHLDLGRVDYKPEDLVYLLEKNKNSLHTLHTTSRQATRCNLSVISASTSLRTVVIDGFHCRGNAEEIRALIIVKTLMSQVFGHF